MNNVPFCGWWFFGAASDAERSARFSSYGLLLIGATPPTGAGGVSILAGLNSSIIGG